jgi:hypothetical protein
MPQQMRRFDASITAHPDAAGIFRDTDGYSDGIALNNLKTDQSPAAT